MQPLGGCGEWEGFEFEGLVVSWRVVRLTLRRTFTTAHSSSDTRDNFFWRIGCKGRAETGYGECGLPPKKKLCYLADVKDCCNFAQALRQRLNDKDRKITNEKLSYFKDKLFEDIPKEYFRYFHKQKIDEETRLLVRRVLLVLLGAYEIKLAQFKAAVSSLEYALLDFLAKTLKESLTNFIFPATQNSQAYSFYTLSYEQEPQNMIQNALQFLEFTTYIKIKYVDDVSALLNLMIQLQSAAKGRVKGYIVDANASWKVESFIKFIELISTSQHDSLRSKIMYIEQPFPIQMSEAEREEWREMKHKSPIKIMVDESFSGWKQIEQSSQLGHAVNIKSEKAGGPISCLRAALHAEKAKLEVMLGSMVSTHLGCSQTYCLHPLTKWLDVDGSLLVETPSLAGGFQWGGNLPLKSPESKYYGLQIDTAKLQS